jgi:PTS system mannose-specific IIB component
MMRLKRRTANMSIVLTRIDNRLIHGQVLEAWVPCVKADCIVVANDEVAGATFQRLLMEAAVPRGIRVFIGSVAETAAAFSSGELEGQRVLLLFGTSGDALKGHRLGIAFGELNLGNMHAGAGKVRLTCTLALAPEDVTNLKALEEEGVRITSQCVPSDRERSWKKLLTASGD